MDIYQELQQFFQKLWDEGHCCLGCGTIGQRTTKGKELSDILRRHHIEPMKVIQSLKPLRYRETAYINIHDHLLFAKCISEETLMDTISVAINWEE